MGFFIARRGPARVDSRWVCRAQPPHKMKAWAVPHAGKEIVLDGRRGRQKAILPHAGKEIVLRCDGPHCSPCSTWAQEFQSV